MEVKIMKIIKNYIFVLFVFIFLMLPMSVKAIDVSDLEVSQNGNQLIIKDETSNKRLSKNIYGR